MTNLIVCTPKFLPQERWISAARTASQINPLNHAPVERLLSLMPDFVPHPLHLAVLTTKYWHAGGVRLTVGFLDSPEADLRKKIVSHMNAWGRTANARFTESKTDPQVRIARAGGKEGGYWSYIGTDILGIARGEPTMNLEGFTVRTPDSEFHRVVRHETGHTLGFPHEHMRKELVDRIDPDKAIEYFGRTQGWSPEEVR